MKKALIVSCGVIVGMFSGLITGASGVEANTAFGNGYYTNLCGSGTAATTYTCNAACNSTTGQCKSDSGGVVRYICSGKWDQCIESEEWGKSKQLGQTSCGKTVQLSVYDKKCRMEDGTWDPTCKLLGYMVWFSGECWGNNSPAPTVGASSATLKVATPTSNMVSPTVKPTVGVTPTTAVGNVCNRECKTNADCGAGFSCAAGVCRNPACVGDGSCFCTSLGVATSAAGISPETGASAWWGVAAMTLLAAGGWKLRRIADRMW